MGVYVLRSNFAYGSSEEEHGTTLAGALHFAEHAGIAGRTRIATYLRLLQVGGYLKSAKRGSDRRYIRLESTPKAIETAKGIYKNFLLPLSLLTENPTAVTDLYRDDRLLNRIVEYSYRSILEFRYISIFTPDLAIILEKAGGYEILLLLMIAEGNSDLRTALTVYFNYGWASQQLDVPRIQIRRVMHLLVEKDLVVLHAEAGNAVEVRPCLRQLLDTLVSLHLAVIWNGVNTPVHYPARC